MFMVLSLGVLFQSFVVSTDLGDESSRDPRLRAANADGGSGGPAVGGESTPTAGTSPADRTTKSPLDRVPIRRPATAANSRAASTASGATATARLQGGRHAFAGKRLDVAARVADHRTAARRPRGSAGW